MVHAHVAKVRDGMHEKAHRFDDSYLKHRTLRSSSSYVDYAKDIFEHITEDRARIELCRSEKKYIGLKKEEFKTLAEDLKYFDLCMKGPLAEMIVEVKAKIAAEKAAMKK